MIPMSIGGLILSGSSVPDSITLGGDQRLAIHELAGGGRVIDVIGPQNRTISWSGVFAGRDAQAMAVQLDLLRQSGATVPLCFADFNLAVVIEHFRYTYALGGLHIAYMIACQPLDSVFVTLDPQSAIGAALGLGAGILAGLPAIAPAVTQAAVIGGLVSSGTVGSYAASDVATIDGVSQALQASGAAAAGTLGAMAGAGLPSTAPGIGSALQAAGGLCASVLGGAAVGQAGMLLSNYLEG